MQKFKIIYRNSFVGIITNAALDLPLILLFNKIGISPYIATVVATSIGYLTSIILTLIYLKKTMKFEYQKTIEILKKIIVPCICMILPIIVGKQLFTYNISTLISFITLAIYGSIGIIVYLFMTYKNNALQEVLGEDLINNVLKKLHLKK
jgi:peptidoglycan biosynthesis protein MviN/MurJ (putative lipid II flippase)